MLLAEMILQGEIFQQKGKLWYVVDSIVRVQNTISQSSCKMAFLSQYRKIQSLLILHSMEFRVASVLISFSGAQFID